MSSNYRSKVDELTDEEVKKIGEILSGDNVITLTADELGLLIGVIYQHSSAMYKFNMILTKLDSKNERDIIDQNISISDTLASGTNSMNKLVRMLIGRHANHG